MTTPINLTQLRERAELNASEAPRQMLIDRDTVTALIDTAEAAIDLLELATELDMALDQEFGTGPYKEHTTITELRETLNHYTTTP
jgi:hypothetical protein